MLAALCVALLVIGLLTFVVIRYRDRGDGGREASTRHDNVALELLYTAIPIVIVAVLFAYTVATERPLTRVSDRPDLEVTVIGFQWQWKFEYPNGVTVTGTPDQPAELVLPVDRTTQLDLTTSDVIHSFWVPAFLVKRDMIPGVDNKIDVTPDRVGTYVGRCAEFCALDHWRMTFDVRVVPQAEFDAWLAAQAA